jgi:acyl-coenzyme A synthetase/AMP-(fatty) acid ligase
VVSPQSLPRTASAKIIKHEVRRWVIDALAGSPAGPVAEAG